MVELTGMADSPDARSRRAGFELPSSALRTGALRWPLLLPMLLGCGDSPANTTARPEIGRCFVLPGAHSGATKSYRVEAGGRLAEAGTVSGGAMHMRAAFHPDGHTLYLSSVGPEGWEPWFEETWEEGIHVRAHSYDPVDCSVGELLGTGRFGPEAPARERAYGLEAHPNGRWLYQTTNSLRRIRLFELAENMVPMPREEFDVTAGGTHACVEIRRLAFHPSGRYLFANCNNLDAGDDALQVWAIERDGTLALVDHHTLPAMDGGVLDPVVHPSGDWLYQPVGTGSPEAPAGRGAYVLIYHIAGDGRLALRDRVPVRTITASDSVAAPTSSLILPMTVLLHPEGGAAYIALNVIFGAQDAADAAFPHEFAIYEVEDGGSRLTEHSRLPALRRTRFSSHHGATLAAYGGELFLYSYLTDYDTIRGGVLQRLRVEDLSLEPLDPPWIATGLPDGRQPISGR